MRSTQAVVGITLAGRPVHGGAALGPAERENREGDIMSTTSTSHPTTRTDPAPVPRPGRALRPRGGRRLLAPLAGMAFAAALVTGCGAEEPTDPEETTAQETQEERSEEHTSELQSRGHLVCRLLLEKKKSTETEQETKKQETYE